MNTKLKSLTTPAIGVALFGAAASPADENRVEVARLIKAGELLSWEDIAKKGEKLYPGGRVTETDLDKEWTRYVYELEVVDRNGVEWDVELDAKTGDVLKQERED